MAKSYNEVDVKVINLIGKETKITGNIISEGDMRIDGELRGDIDCKGRLVIGPTGVIVGEIKCTTCEIAGNTKGKITVVDLLSLKSSSNVHGDIIANKLSIEPGAVFSGSCSMGNKTTNEVNQNQKEAL